MLRSAKYRNTRFASLLLLGLIIIPVVNPVTQKLTTITQNFTLPNKQYRVGYAQIDQDLENLASFLRKNSSNMDAIFSGVTNHDQFIINDVIVYFLSSMRYSTKYHELHPGVTTTLPIQNMIINELENSAPRFVVLTSGYWHEPNETTTDLKIDRLDQYIRNNFKLFKIFGKYEIWVPINDD